MRRLSPLMWLGVVGLPLVGFVLLWWADQQASDMLIGSTVGPPKWGVLGWLLTMIAGGFVFGLAAGIAGANPKMASPAALLVLGIIPAAVIIYFTSVFGVGWLTLYINDVTAFLITPATVAVSCVAVGLLAAALIGTRTAPS